MTGKSPSVGPALMGVWSRWRGLVEWASTLAGRMVAGWCAVRPGAGPRPAARDRAIDLIEGELDCLIEDATDRSITERSAEELLLNSEILRWLRGGELPGQGAVELLEENAAVFDLATFEVERGKRQALRDALDVLVRARPFQKLGKELAWFSSQRRRQAHHLHGPRFLGAVDEADDADHIDLGPRREPADRHVLASSQFVEPLPPATEIALRRGLDIQVAPTPGRERGRPRGAMSLRETGGADPRSRPPEGGGRPMSPSSRRRPAGDPAALARQFGANLGSCREEVGLTPEELAAGAEMGLELLIELEEAGGAIPSVGLVLRLAGSLGRAPSVLVAGVSWVPYELVEGEGTFEVLDDPGLVAEIATLNEARERPARSGLR